MNYFKKLVGTKVYLSPINVEDYEKFTEWLADFEVTVNLTSYGRIIFKNHEKECLEDISTDNNSFAIVTLADHKLLGSCGFHNVDTTNRRTEIGIFIGDKEYWGKGYGSEALELLLDFGFNIRNFNSVMLAVRAYNQRAIHCYEKIGFQKIGARREACIFGERKYDVIYMDLLASEFESKYIGKFLDEKIIPKSNRMLLESRKG
ncbi:MAG TPA: GNAT family protein [Bacillota bacterium]|nr:GNAT family protein [Bacillota bacterium]